MLARTITRTTHLPATEISARLGHISSAQTILTGVCIGNAVANLWLLLGVNKLRDEVHTIKIEPECCNTTY